MCGAGGATPSVSKVISECGQGCLFLSCPCPELSSVAELTSFQLSSPSSWKYLPPNPLQKNLLDLRQEGLEGEDRKGSRGLYGPWQRLAFCFVLLFIFTKRFPVAGSLLPDSEALFCRGGNDEHPRGVREHQTTHTFIKNNSLFLCISTQVDALCLN